MNRRGVTLIELMVVASILAIALSFIYAGVRKLYPTEEKQQPQEITKKVEFEGRWEGKHCDSDMLMVLVLPTGERILCSSGTPRLLLPPLPATTATMLEKP